MLYTNLLANKFKLDQKQLKQFSLYYQFLTQENKKYNLTALTSLSEVYGKHFYDSLILKEILEFKKIKNLCDVGSGAGFPSFPLKIIYPHLRITIIESSLKKIIFLKQLAPYLSLENIFFFHQRVEKHTLSYDCVVTRALGKLSLILPWCFPLIKKRGYFLAMKGKKYEEELKDSQSIIQKLKIDLIKTNTQELPNQLGTRVNLLFQTS
ncbi:16S rRNA (guanine(527)-N(7))-methyltransferase [Candidatus Phytoplasma solani]|uniref:16S rRNA (guanine(527)-N(7))-methyltransferase RsmG n=1 Tax=Candidatus Phytoplasma solani TaxID=69896 RepID=UPI0032DA460F